MESSSEDEVVPTKRKCLPQNVESESCIICGRESPITDLTKPKDYSSWKTLLSAGNIHKCEAIIQYADTETVPDIYYHSKCRQTLTLKKTLNAILAKEGQLPIADVTVRTSERKSGIDSTSRVYELDCIFCQRKAKYIRGCKSRETLCQSLELRSGEKIQSIAKEKIVTDKAREGLHKRILAVTSRELVAAEACYHKSCYRDYTRGMVNKPSTNPGTSKSDDHYDQAVIDAYDILFNYIRTNLFLKPKLVTMIQLTCQLVQILNSLGIPECKQHTKDHIRRKLENEFGSTLHIFPNEKGKLLVMPSNMPIESLAIENIRLAEELKSHTSEESKQTVRKCALVLRADLKKCKSPDEWPPTPEKLDNDYVPIPESVTEFLRILLTGETQKTPDIQPSSRVQRLINSFAQDYVFAVSVGRVKPAKHILLPGAVKSLTGNGELIKFLNRFGNGVSYSQLEEIDTAQCLQKLKMGEETGVTIPSNILPEHPTNLVWDNIDRVEETLSGKGTSHRVNGIIVQCRPKPEEYLPLDMPVKQPEVLPSIDKSKKRCISPTPVILQPYNGQRRSAAYSRCHSAHVREKKWH